MRKPTFLSGVLIAAVLAVASAMLFALPAISLLGVHAAKLTLAVIFILYLCYLVTFSRRRAGRIALPLLAALGILSSALILPAIPEFVIACSLIVWLSRSLLFYERALPAVVDATLITVACFAAVIAWGNSHSVFLSVWTYFLCQALFSSIPDKIAAQSSHEDKAESRFLHSRRVAETAVQRLYTTH